MCVNDYIQGDLAPVSGVHFSMIFLDQTAKSWARSGRISMNEKTRILRCLKHRYALIFSPVHILSLYLDAMCAKKEVHEFFRVAEVKPFSENDVSQCLIAVRRLCRKAKS